MLSKETEFRIPSTLPLPADNSVGLCLQLRSPRFTSVTLASFVKPIRLDLEKD
jgi:hypothetical protein